MPDTPERDPTTGIPMPPAFGAGQDPQSLEYIAGDLTGGYNTLPSWVTEKYSPHQIEAAMLAALRDQVNQSNLPRNDQEWANIKTGAPPALQEQGNPYSFRAFPDIFKKGAPASGGYFSLDDYYGQMRKPDDNSNFGAVPGQFQFGSGGPSTNNWRILPHEYRNPDKFMINGHIISRGKFGVQAGGLEGHNMGQELGTGLKGYWPGNYGAPWISAAGTTNPGLGGSAQLTTPFYLGQVT
jgi:hypothetical protein